MFAVAATSCLRARILSKRELCALSSAGWRHRAQLLWYRIIQEMISDGIKADIEIGPGKVLQGLSKRINPALNMYGAETHQDIVNLNHV